MRESKTPRLPIAYGSLASEDSPIRDVSMGPSVGRACFYRSLLWCGLSALMLTAPTGWADMWTNAAGHAIEADLVDLTDGNVLLERADGSRLELPLSSLSVASRLKAKAQRNIPSVPEGIRPVYHRCCRTLRRLSQLHDAQHLNDDAYARRRKIAMQSLRQACARLNNEGLLDTDGANNILFSAMKN